MQQASSMSTIQRCVHGLFSLAFLCTLYTSVKPIRSPLPYRLHSDAMHVITGG